MSIAGGSLSMPKDRSVFARSVWRSNARSAAFMLLAVLLAAATVSAQHRRIQLDDLAKVVTVCDPQISPDGHELFYTGHGPDEKVTMMATTIMTTDGNSAAAARARQKLSFALRNGGA